MKLISAVKYSDYLDEKYSFPNEKWFLHRVYVDFLKRNLELGMFIPCDEKGKIIEEPEMYGWFQNVGGTNSHATEQDGIDCDKYHFAKLRCLFEFNPYFLSFNKSDMEGCTIENLLTDDIEYTLTQTKIKQLGL